MNMEYIKSAAIKLPDKIFTGRYHSICFVKLKRSVEQGFIATKNCRPVFNCMEDRFVNRKEALKIAKAAGQKINKHAPKDILLSEDLFNDDLFEKEK